MSVYQGTLDGLRARFAAHDPEQMAARSGATRPAPDRLVLRCAGRDYEVLYPDGTVLEAGGEPAEVSVAILLLLYLMESTDRAFEGRWIAFEQLPGGQGYRASFRGRVVQPILRTFGSHPHRLLEAARGLDGEPMDLGDVSVRIPALPRVPVVYTMWRGDDEFPPNAHVVFDASVGGYLDAEVLTALAEVVTRRLVAAVSADRQDKQGGKSR